MSTIKVNRVEPFSGSTVTVVGLNLDSASVDYDLIFDKPPGLVSGSSQLTSSYDERYIISGAIQPADFNTLLNRPANIVSSSQQLASDISGSFTLTSQSIAVDINTISLSLSSLETESGSVRATLNTFTGSTNGRLQSLETESGSIRNVLSTFTGSTNNRLQTLETESGSIRTTLNNYTSSTDSKLSNIENFTSSQAGLNSTFAVVNQNNTFSGTQTFNNIAVNGTGSFGYIQSVTGSAKIIGDAFIVLNVAEPPLRFAGIKVEDSGSTSGLTGSFFYDAEADHWGYESVDNYVAAFLSGPTGSFGSFSYPTNNKILKSTGENYVGDSNITDDGSIVSISTPLSGTEITGSLIKATTSFIGNLTGNSTTATSASHAVNADTASLSNFATNAGTANTASYVEFTNVDSVPTFLLGSQFNVYTGSTDTRLSLLETESGSVRTTLNTFTSSQNASNLTFATTGSNTFNGNQTISGSLSISGSVNNSTHLLTISSDTASLDASIGNTFQLNILSGSTTRLEISNQKAGQTMNLLVSQSSDGIGSLVLGDNIHQPTGSVYTPTAFTSSEDIVTFATFVNPNKIYMVNVKEFV